VSNILINGLILSHVCSKIDSVADFRVFLEVELKKVLIFIGFLLDDL